VVEGEERCRKVEAGLPGYLNDWRSVSFSGIAFSLDGSGRGVARASLAAEGAALGRRLAGRLALTGEANRPTTRCRGGPGEKFVGDGGGAKCKDGRELQHRDRLEMRVVLGGRGDGE
jgi:hypothetical protein